MFHRRRMPKDWEEPFGGAVLAERLMFADSRGQVFRMALERAGRIFIKLPQGMWTMKQLVIGGKPYLLRQSRDRRSDTDSPNEWLGSENEYRTYTREELIKKGAEVFFPGWDEPKVIRKRLDEHWFEVRGFYEGDLPELLGWKAGEALEARQYIVKVEKIE